jgi:hypothetical protein
MRVNWCSIDDYYTIKYHNQNQIDVISEINDLCEGSRL